MNGFHLCENQICHKEKIHWRILNHQKQSIKFVYPWWNGHKRHKTIFPWRKTFHHINLFLVLWYLAKTHSMSESMCPHVNSVDQHVSSSCCFMSRFPRVLCVICLLVHVSVSYYFSCQFRVPTCRFHVLHTLSSKVARVNFWSAHISISLWHALFSWCYRAISYTSYRNIYHRTPNDDSV